MDDIKDVLEMATPVRVVTEVTYKGNGTVWVETFGRLFKGTLVRLQLHVRRAAGEDLM